MADDTQTLVSIRYVGALAEVSMNKVGASEQGDTSSTVKRGETIEVYADAAKALVEQEGSPWAYVGDVEFKGAPLGDMEITFTPSPSLPSDVKP